MKKEYDFSKMKAKKNLYAAKKKGVRVNLGAEMIKYLKLAIDHANPKFKRIDVKTFDGYTRSLIEYRGSEGDRITAFLFEPTHVPPASCPGILIHHQHNGEQFLGKSEVAGIKGNSLQAFGPALAKRGFVVLAPDQICFEDRRRNKKGVEPSEGDEDFLQQFNEMTYRLVKGDTLMRKVLDDAAIGLSLLFYHKSIDQKRIGVMGHSLGGNTTLFQAATDERVRCSGVTPFGYTYLEGKLVVGPHEYKTVLEILRLLSKGKSIRAIARYLNDQKVRTRKGKLWSHFAVNSIIQREQKPKGGPHGA